jgi:two-component system chemotaxis response regulator CheY
MAGEPRKVVLIVDDEIHLREILRFDLRTIDCDFLEAGNGREALEVIGGRAVDLVISDVRMPVASGVDMLKAMRLQQRLHPPVVLMTAVSDLSREEALELGVAAVLRKPLDKEDLLAVVGKLLVRAAPQTGKSRE